MNANPQQIAKCNAQKGSAGILHVAKYWPLRQVIDFYVGQNDPMKGTLYASFQCGAPGLGAYTPMGISPYHRLPHQGNSGDTPVQAQQRSA
jgi:hypothetical protein